MHDTSGQFVGLFVALPVGMTAILAIVLALFPTLWNRAVPISTRARNHTMDGARGLLTLWVLSYHLDEVPWAVKSATHWQLPANRLGALMDTGFFIAPFFALTAMLFGGSLMQSQGKLDVVQFLKNRAFRLTPAYLISILVVFAAAFWLAGGHLRVGYTTLFHEMVRWGAFGFLRRFDINGVDLSQSHAMLWTLPFEISFYLLLPALAFGQRKFRSPAFLFVALAVLGVFFRAFVFFAGGIAAAALVSLRHRHAKLGIQVAGVAALITLVLTAYHTSAVLQAALIAPILAGIAREEPLFSPLRAKSLRFVGEISYSVYMLHFPILWVTFLALGGPGKLATVGLGERWVILIGCGLVILTIATLCYLIVERPFIAFGKSLKPGRGLVKERSEIELKA